MTRIAEDIWEHGNSLRSSNLVEEGCGHDERSCCVCSIWSDDTAAAAAADDTASQNSRGTSWGRLGEERSSSFGSPETTALTCVGSDLATLGFVEGRQQEQSEERRKWEKQPQFQ
jgi:hypothetical protein